MIDNIQITTGVTTAPSITAQPQNQTITSGQTATLNVTASGTAPLSYQWYQGTTGTTTTQVGTNAASFTTPALSATTSYWVRVSNSAGQADSDTATVTVNAVVDQPITTGGATTLTTTEGTAASALVTASDPDSTITSATITSAAVAGISLSGFATGPNGTASVSLDVNGNVASGSYPVDIQFANNTNQTATATVTVTVNPPVGGCPTPSTTLISIPALQGTGDINTANGQTRTVRGIVVADFQSSPGLSGFNIQDSAGDGNVLTSDGVFVFAPNGVDVAVGEAVQVSGRATEFNGMTEIDTVSSIVKCGTDATLAPTPISLPETTNGDLERYEGMLVSIAQTLTVQQNFFQGRYGQVTLGAGGRLYQPTNRYDAGTAQALAEADTNARSMIVLDDAISAQNPNPLAYIGQNDTLRAGDTVAGLVGALDYGAINSVTTIRDYRLQPTQPVNITRVNDRTAAPATVGGNAKVASFNVLNYFNGDGQGGSFPTSRGASSLVEFNRQRAKIIAAINAIDPDVAGLMEMENDGTGALSAVQDLVNGLNATTPGKYAIVIDPAPGTDEIRVAMIYQPGRVSLVGAAANYQVSDPTYGAALFDRPPLAQTFQHVDTGAKFTVIVNHFKSKGSCPSGANDIDADKGDGQGCWNAKRTQQAQALLNFISARQQAAADTDVLVIGDLNAYGMEDPIQALTGGGLINTIYDKIGNDAYSYVFDGMSGYLDHALATSSLNSQISGVAEWHINADEPSVIDYNVEFKQNPNCTGTCTSPDYYTATPYRASDHDPVVVGLNLAGTPTPTDPSGTGSAAPNPVTAGNQTLLTVSVTPGANPLSTGLGVTADLTTIGGSASQALVDNGLNGDVTAGDNVFSFAATVSANSIAGAKSLPFTITDAQLRSASGTIALTVQAPVVAANVVISEFRTRGPSGGNDEFVELYNRSANSVDISGWKINGSNNTGTASTRVTITSGVVLGSGCRYLATNSGSSGYSGTTTGNQTYASGFTDDGGVALLNAVNAVIDAVGMSNGSAYKEGTILSPTTTNVNQSYERKPGGGTDNSQDSDNNANDFTLNPATSNPQNLSSACTPPNNPTNPSGNGTADPATVQAGGNTTLTVLVTPGTNPASTNIVVTADLTDIGGAAAQVFTNNGNGNFSFNATVHPNTAGGAKSLPFTIADGQNRTASGTIALTVTTVDPCLTAYTHIYSIQGSGTTAAITGTVTTQGVVVGDFEGTSGLTGFYLQDVDGDGDSATSDGIFVFTGSANTVSAGQLVRVTGFARERFNQTALNATNSNTDPVTAANILSCGTAALPAPASVSMPFTSATDPERFEGMRVNFGQSLTIAESFNYDRFGELVLAYGDDVAALGSQNRLYTPTSIVEPGAPAIALAAQYALRRITLDDGLSIQNPPTLRHPNGSPFSLNNRFRGGDTVQNVVGVLGYDFSVYRIQPTAPADYSAVNVRTAAPEAVGGNLRVGTFNTLNYFLTIDTTVSDTGGGPCGPSQTLDCRGADDSGEFARQRAKLIQAIIKLDADALGLNELENTSGVEPLADIVAGLNAQLGSGTYAYIDTGTIGTDAIKVGIIYKPATLSPVGAFKTLTSAVDPRFIDTRSRPSLAQTFEQPNGARFTMAVNHLKSKGSACANDPDTGDGQGNCNITRTDAAKALVDWLASDPTNSGDPDFIILGDLNSYAMEDPIDAIRAGADDAPGTADDWTNLTAAYKGTYAYSYVFDGQLGYLDHALGNASITSQVTGLTEWHINSDEPDIFDYDTTFKPDEQDALYEPNAYRTSDHDPVIVGLNLTAPNHAPVANNQSVTTAEDTAANITLTASDSDNDALSYTMVDQPQHGALSGTVPNLTYTPAANYNGPDSFTFKANDGTVDSNVATVSISVTAVNDNPTAVNDSYTTAEDTPLTVAAPGVLANDSDVDGNTLTVSSAGTAGSGTATIGADGALSYTPNANFCGPDSVSYTVADGNNGTATATVAITVTCANDAPTISTINNQTTNEDTATGAIAFTVGDAETAAASLTLSASSSNTTLVPNANIAFGGSGSSRTVTIVPAANQFGTATITLVVSDGVLTASSSFVLTVTAVNDPPTALNDTATVKKNKTVTISVLANDSDVENNALTVTATSTPAHGSVVRNANGTIKYSPQPAYTGTDTFTYTISDGHGGTATATVTVTVTK